MDRVGSLADLFIASHSENLLSSLYALPIRTTCWPMLEKSKVGPFSLEWATKMGSAARLIMTWEISMKFF